MIDVSAAATWNTTLGQLQLIVTPANYETWLRDTIGLRHEPDRFVVGAQSDFATEWLTTRLRGLIVKTLAVVIGRPIDVEFEVVRPADPAPPPLLSEPEQDAALGQQRRSRAAPPALNALLTFDEFVVAEENRVAYDAARNAVSAPGAMNPLLIFGESGMGKTHLLHAIGHDAYDRGLAVICSPAERFGNEYNRARESNRWDAMRERYRSADILLIDDIQFFEGKDKFQEEFFHTFNDLHAAGKQIVMTVDRKPYDLAGLVERLRSRLHWGLVADLRRPSFDTRLAILKRKALRHAMRLPEEVLHMIAEKCCPSVRELEGYLNRVIAYLPLKGAAPSPALIEEALSPIAPAPAAPRTPTADEIVAAVCARTGVQPGDLRGQTRSRDVTYARHLAMYLMKEDGLRPVAEIGREFGHRDHSTVLAGIERIRKELPMRNETRDDLHAIRTTLTDHRTRGDEQTG